jgi:CMP-N-acetylneuraminic acid synthetase
MKVIGFVPVKLNNERLENKNIKSFENGKPLINYILNTAIQVNDIDEIYVYCSSEKIQDYLPPQVKFLKRPKNLDLPTAGGLDLIENFKQAVYADIYIKLHATSPFTKIESIEKGLNAVISGYYDSAFPVIVNHDFFWIDGKSNYDTENIPRTQDLKPFYIETTGFYIYNHDIAEQRRRIGDTPFFIEVSKIEAIDINEPIDFEIANAIYNYIIKLEE